MSGLAKTNKFLLASATVMIGAPADLKDFVPNTHSIGLVKNFTIGSEPSYTELTQGVKGTIVDSMLTSNPVTASMEVYEYTASNVAYGLGLNGSGFSAQTVNNTLASAINSTPTTSMPLTSASGFAANDVILIEVDTIDNFAVRKIASIATNTLTLDKAIANVPSGAKVYKVNAIDIGSKTDQPFFAAKITGKATNGEHMVIEIPKIRIIKGFNLSFNVSDYNNMPFEFQVYDLASTDANYAEFGANPARFYTRS